MKSRWLLSRCLNLISIVLLLMATCTSFTGICQNASMFGFDTRRINVKTPNAASIEAFSRVGVNHATGVPDISVPIYDLTLDNALSVPIRLRYHASGFKFGELPGVVGYKWALDAGGMISRDINGMSDESYYFSHYNDIPTIVDSMRNDGVSYDETTLGQYYLKNFSNNNIDINQDYYSLNYFNGSANLVYKNGKFYTETDTYKLKIEGFNEFTVTDENGYKYLFGGQAVDDTYYEKSDPSHSSSPGSNDPDFNQGTLARTGWLLRKVISPFGKEINFEYVRYNLGYVPGNISETYKKGFVTSGSNPTPCGCPAAVLTVVHNGGSYQTSLVSRIYSDDTEVLFNYSDNSGLAYWKKELDSIIIKHKVSGAIIKKVTFEYGSFDNLYLKLAKVNEVSIHDTADKKTYSFEYNTNLTLPGIESYSRDIFGYYNGATNARLISTTNSIYTQTYTSANRTPNINYAKQTMLSAITYPTGGKASFTYELNQVGTKYAPGVRIREISRYTSGSELADKTVYEYSGLFGGTNSPFTIPFDFSDTYNCTIYTFKSDYPLNDRIARNYYYSTVKVKQVGASEELAEVYNYEALVNRQGLYVPYLKQEVKYLGATTQKVSEVINNYETEEIDSLTTTNTISLGAQTAYRGVGTGIYCFPYYLGIQEMTPAPGYNLIRKLLCPKTLFSIKALITGILQKQSARAVRAVI